MIQHNRSTEEPRRTRELCDLEQPAEVLTDERAEQVRGGEVTYSGGYNTWRANFGRTA